MALQPTNRIYNFAARQQKEYKAVIYQHLDANGVPLPIYDVEISIGVGKNPAGANRKIVHEHITRSSKNVIISKLTSYMHWKFRHCQRSSDPRVTPIRSNGVFTYLNNSLEWIRSVIEVEFDFHVGAQNCLRVINRTHLKQYRKNQFECYAPTFYKMN